MDPADQELIYHALNAQWILVGLHNQMLWVIMDSLQTIGSTVSLLCHRINLLTSQPTAPPSATPSTVSSPAGINSAQPHSHPAREHLVKPPEHYSGDSGFCDSFFVTSVVECSYLKVQPYSYTSERSRISYTVTLWRENAAQHCIMGRRCCRSWVIWHLFDIY